MPTPNAIANPRQTAYEMRMQGSVSIRSLSQVFFFFLTADGIILRITSTIPLLFFVSFVRDFSTMYKNGVLACENALYRFKGY